MAFSTPETREKARRRLIRFVVLGIASYALAMVATMPASIAFKNRPWRTGVGGTVWNGEVGVAGAAAVRWNWSLLGSLANLGLAYDWKAQGPHTEMAGHAVAGLNGLTIEDTAGTADIALLAALQPGLPFACDLTGQVEFPRIAVGGSGQMIVGRARSEGGTCTARSGGVATALPPLLMTAEKIGSESRIRVVPATQRRRVLVDAVLNEDGALAVKITADGARELPFLGAPGAVTVRGKM